MNKFNEYVAVVAMGLVFGALFAWGMLGNQVLSMFH